MANESERERERDECASAFQYMSQFHLFDMTYFHPDNSGSHPSKPVCLFWSVPPVYDCFTKKIASMCHVYPSNLAP